MRFFLPRRSGAFSALGVLTAFGFRLSAFGVRGSGFGVRGSEFAARGGGFFYAGWIAARSADRSVRRGSVRPKRRRAAAWGRRRPATPCSRVRPPQAAARNGRYAKHARQNLLILNPAWQHTMLLRFQFTNFSPFHSSTIRFYLLKFRNQGARPSLVPPLQLQQDRGNTNIPLVISY